MIADPDILCSGIHEIGYNTTSCVKTFWQWLWSYAHGTRYGESITISSHNAQAKPCVIHKHMILRDNLLALFLINLAKTVTQQATQTIIHKTFHILIHRMWG
jgi:hypothetical protein